MWQCYSKQMANDANTESVHCWRRTSSKCSVGDWNSKFHLQRDSVFDQLVNKLVLLVENELWKAMFKNIGQYLDGRSANVRD